MFFVGLFFGGGGGGGGLYNGVYERGTTVVWCVLFFVFFSRGGGVYNGVYERGITIAWCVGEGGRGREKAELATKTESKREMKYH